MGACALILLALMILPSAGDLSSPWGLLATVISGYLEWLLLERIYKIQS